MRMLLIARVEMTKIQKIAFYKRMFDRLDCKCKSYCHSDKSVCFIMEMYLGYLISES